MIDNISHQSLNVTVEDLINDPLFDINQYHGYIYLTINTITGFKYLGKKNFFHSSQKKLGKKELESLPQGRGRKPTKKLVIKESDWKNYYGSSNQVKQTPKENMVRYVLKLCKNKKELTYWETKLLFTLEVLEHDEYINDNILGKFYRIDFL
jgi:hypothetical protein